jgi:hypothetical protein
MWLGPPADGTHEAVITSVVGAQTAHSTDRHMTESANFLLILWIFSLKVKAARRRRGFNRGRRRRRPAEPFATT